MGFKLRGVRIYLGKKGPESQDEKAGVALLISNYITQYKNLSKEAEGIFIYWETEQEHRHEHLLHLKRILNFFKQQLAVLQREIDICLTPLESNQGSQDLRRQESEEKKYTASPFFFCTVFFPKAFVDF